MTRGLELSTLQLGHSHHDQIAYKEYKNTFNKLKHDLMHNYYKERVIEYKNNTKLLWKTINNVIKKTKHNGGIIGSISINGIKTYDPYKIAQEFGSFYANLGANLASKIEKGKYNINEYLDKILRNTESLVLKGVTIKEVEKVITQLPNKTSHGHDQISNKFLKEIYQVSLDV